MFKVRTVKIDTGLNKVVWEQGLKRLRGKGNRPCIVASHVPVQSFKNLKTKNCWW